MYQASNMQRTDLGNSMALIQNNSQNWQQLHISVVAQWANNLHACNCFLFSTSNFSATNDYWKIFRSAKFAKSSRSAHGQPLQPHKYNKIILYLCGCCLKWTCSILQCAYLKIPTHVRRYINIYIYKCQYANESECVWLGKRKSIKCIVYAWKIDLFRIKLVDTLPHGKATSGANACIASCTLWGKHHTLTKCLC